MFPAGTRFGPYEIIAPLGAGAMGEVYRARDPRLGRDVAVKVLPPELAGDAQRRSRFEHEARAASSLNHPHIVPIYDIGSSDSTLYIAMELVEGHTLRELIASGPLPGKKVLDLAVQMTDALAKAHEAGIVHRDLKPENLMISKEGHIKVLDFGLAKLVETSAGATEGATATKHTDAGVVLGTVGYMSPEQASGQRVDFRSDQFSLGAILYEMASGKRAFQRRTAPETLAAILREQSDPLSRFGSQLPPPLRWIIEERCLAKDPEDRYGLTRDLLHDLKDLRDHLSEVSSGSVAAPRPSSRRRRALVTVAVLVAFALGSALTFVAGRQVGKRAAVAMLEAAPSPSFRQLTFRRGTIWSARFAPDGQTIVYGAAWDGGRVEPFLTRSERPESRALGFRGTEILSISSSGEMAISLDRRIMRTFAQKGTLARAPLLGGAPRPILEDVEWADWSPDGGSLAVVRTVGGKAHLEFPVGKTLYETSGWISHLRVSPKGDLVAFLEHPVAAPRGWVAVVDVAGRKKTLGHEWRNALGLAWAPGGDEIWFTASETGISRAVQAVTLSGRERVVVRVPGSLMLHDIAHDGRLLLTRESNRRLILGLAPGQTKEQDLSSLDNSLAADLSADGRTLLIREAGGVTGLNPSIYLRRSDSASAPILLGEGVPLALSPDLKWALALLLSSPSQLMLVPTGPGDARQLPRTGLQYDGAANWFPDGKRILCSAHEPDRAIRIYVQDLEGARPRPVTPEGASFPFGTHPLSPDGVFVAATGADGKGYLYAVEGGEPRIIAGFAPGEVTAGWGANGRSLYVYRPGEPSCKVFRLDLVTGRRELWKEIAAPDPAGVIGIQGVLLTTDTVFYVYDFLRVLSDLYLVEGLK